METWKEFSVPNGDADQPGWLPCRGWDKGGTENYAVKNSLKKTRSCLTSRSELNWAVLGEGSVYSGYVYCVFQIWELEATRVSVSKSEAEIFLAQYKYWCYKKMQGTVLGEEWLSPDFWSVCWGRTENPVEKL